MVKNIKGIHIELGANTKPLQSALKDVDKASVNTTKELGQINRALKFDEFNPQLLGQKFDVLQDAIGNTSTRLEALRKAQAEVNRQFQSGEIDSATFRSFNRELEVTEGKLRAFEKQAEDVKAKIVTQVDTSSLEKAKTQIKDLGSAAKQAGKEIASGISTGAAGATAAVTGLVVGMQDTNIQLAMLETQANNAGLSLEEIGKARAVFASVNQDVGQVTEAIGNLTQAGYTSEESITKVAEGIAGAITAYGETFNAEGLAESIATTTALGEVTGQFMDLLEKENVNVEDFNAVLQSMSSEQERANFITKAFAEEGLNAAYEAYKKAHPEIVANTEAQTALMDQTSKLTVALTPLLTTVTEVITKLVEWVNNNQTLATVLAVISGAITGVAAVLMALSPIINTVITLWPHLAKAFAAIGGPITIAIAAITGIIAVLVLAYNKVEWFRDGVNSAWNYIKEMTSVAFGAVKELITSLISSSVEFGQEILGKFAAFWDENGQTIVNFVQKHFGQMKEDMQTILGAIQKVFEKIWPVISKVVQVSTELIQLTVGSMLDIILGLISAGMKLLQGDWEGAWESIEKIAKNIMENIINFFEDINLFDSGKAIIQSAIDGLLSMKDKILRVVDDITGAIRDFWPFSPAKRGPLSDINKMDFAGPIGDSIEKARNPLEISMTHLAQTVANVMPRMAAIEVPRMPNYNLQPSSTSTSKGTQNITIMLDSEIIGRAVAPIVGEEIVLKVGRW
ncbi:hypothetical protein ACQKMN_16935 [Ureibacillus composti]